MRFEEQTEEQVGRIAERVAASEGIEVVGVECRGGSRTRLVRIYIDKPEGISHQDCELVSRQLSAILDVEDLIPGSYRLEVSSPGAERKLVKAADYQRFTGRKARIQLKRELEGKRRLTGRLQGCRGGEVSLETADSVVRVRLEDIESARLVVEF